LQQPGSIDQGAALAAPEIGLLAVLGAILLLGVLGPVSLAEIQRATSSARRAGGQRSRVRREGVLDTSVVAGAGTLDQTSTTGRERLS
jgi:hypothetical protein